MLNELAQEITYWRAQQEFVTGWNNLPVKLMLCVTELSETMDAYRNNCFAGVKEELADTMIRVLDICGALDIDIEQVIHDKMIENRKRPKMHGKMYNDAEWIKKEA